MAAARQGPLLLLWQAVGGLSGIGIFSLSRALSRSTGDFKCLANTPPPPPLPSVSAASGVGSGSVGGPADRACRQVQAEDEGVKALPRPTRVRGRVATSYKYATAGGGTVPDEQEDQRAARVTGGWPDWMDSRRPLDGGAGWGRSLGGPSCLSSGFYTHCASPTRCQSASTEALLGDERAAQPSTCGRWNRDPEERSDDGTLEIDVEHWQGDRLNSK